MPPREGPPMVRRESRLSRRAFVLAAGSVGLLAGCGRLPGQAEAPAKAPRIGFLDLLRPPAHIEWFQDALRERGYVDGQNIVIEYRSADGERDRLPSLAVELVQVPVGLIVPVGIGATRAAKDATSTIPIVWLLTGDPVRNGLAQSFAHPGGNLTGLSEMPGELNDKRLELLKQAVPSASRVAVLGIPAEPSQARQFQEMAAAARVLGVELQSLPVGSPADIEGAVKAAARERADALFLLNSFLTDNYKARIAELATGSWLPTMGGLVDFPAQGGLMAYGSNQEELVRRSAAYVDKIIKGANPADLPIEQPMRFEFVVNLKTARELGITFPNEIMLQVTEVIQ
jgi:putative tryptophan/tyrosine transport system substrate-binding protein